MTANTPRSRKSKGMQFQKEVIGYILDYFPDLTENDLKSIPSGVPGEDIWVSEVGKRRLPCDFECKRTERLDLWKSIAQVEKRCEKTGKIPVLVFRKNRSNPMVCIGLQEFLQMLEEYTK